MAARTKKSSRSRSPVARLASAPLAFCSALRSAMGAAAQRLAPTPDALGRAVVASAWLALAAGLVFVSMRGVPSLRAWAESRATTDPSTVHVRFETTPSWMPSESLATLAEDSRLALGEASALDAAALTSLHRHLAATGWFDRVEQVRRTRADEIVVTAEFLVPFALVRSGDEDCVVDQNARRLPLVYSGPGPRPALPLIVGVHLPRPAEPGTPWIGRDIRASLRLAALIRDRAWFAAGQVREIDASRFSEESLLELVTDRSTRVVWGGDPDGRAIGEMPSERKLACLDALYHGTRRIDDATGRSLDLRFDVVTLAPSDPSMPIIDRTTGR